MCEDALPNPVASDEKGHALRKFCSRSLFGSIERVAGARAVVANIQLFLAAKNI